MNPRWNFLDARTIILSMFVGALAGSAFGSETLGFVVWVVVYVFAALEPRNHSTCPDCGTGLNPRATVCPGCGYVFDE